MAEVKQDMAEVKQNQPNVKHRKSVVTGVLDGQRMFVALTKLGCQDIKNGWCRKSGSGRGGWGNPAKFQQMRMMLEKYLALAFPASDDQPQNSMKTRVSWSGEILSVVTFKASDQTDLDKLCKDIFKSNVNMEKVQAEVRELKFVARF